MNKLNKHYYLGYCSRAWCKCGTRNPGPKTLGPETWDPCQSLKVAPQNPAENLKVGLQDFTIL